MECTAYIPLIKMRRTHIPGQKPDSGVWRGRHDDAIHPKWDVQGGEGMGDEVVDHPGRVYATEELPRGNVTQQQLN